MSPSTPVQPASAVAQAMTAALHPVDFGNFLRETPKA
jgi:hypothetical protein